MGEPPLIANCGLEWLVDGSAAPLPANKLSYFQGHEAAQDPGFLPPGRVFFLHQRKCGLAPHNLQGKRFGITSPSLACLWYVLRWQPKYQDLRFCNLFLPTGCPGPWRRKGFFLSMFPITIPNSRHFCKRTSGASSWAQSCKRPARYAFWGSTPMRGA